MNFDLAQGRILYLTPFPPRQESVYFERVNASMKEFTINTTDGINFAVSANTKHSSSGMVWAQCTASESDGESFNT